MRPPAFRRVRLALAISFVLPSAVGTLHAQEPPLVLPGDRVRIQVRESPPGAHQARGEPAGLREGSHTGTVSAIVADSLYFAPDRDGLLRPVAWTSLESVDRSTGTVPLRTAVGRGAVAGAGVGLIAAAIQFAASGGACRDMANPRCFMTAEGFAILFGSVALGGLIGATMAGEHWQRVFPAEIAVGPLDRGSAGMAVALSVRLK